MIVQNSSPQPFTAQGIYIGGIYPFDGEQSIAPSIVQERIRKSKLFRSDFPDRNTFISYRRLMYDPEQRWSDLTQVLFFETILHKCVLSTGRNLQEIPFHAYLLIYPTGFATIIFWISLSEDTFQCDEIIELAAVARGTVERINPSQKVVIDMDWKDQSFQVNNIVEICRMLEKEFRSTILNNNVSSESRVQFVYPIVYVQEVVNCTSAKDIIDRYSLEVAGLANLWIHKTQCLKHEEVERIIKSDFHPFETGIACVSIGSTVELHPKVSIFFLQEESLTFEEHHYEERTLLAFICELLVAQYFILRVHDIKLSSMHSFLQTSHISLLNPLYLFILMYNAVKLTKIERELTLAINEFRNIYLKRKSYYQHAINLYREAFATSSVEESIDKKLLALQSHISTTYSMLTTIFILVLSVITTIFGIFQGIQAAQSFGWFH